MTIKSRMAKVKEVGLTRKSTTVKSEIKAAHAKNLGMAGDRLKLEVLYDRLATLTRSRCGEPCGRPGFCCKPEFCEMTMRHAKDEFGVQLNRTKHPRLPLMNSDGYCTVPPYLRSECTKYVCKSHLLEDVEFEKQYLWILSKIDEIEKEF